MAWISTPVIGSSWENPTSPQTLTNNAGFAPIHVFDTRRDGALTLQADTTLHLTSIAETGWWIAETRVLLDPAGNTGARLSVTISSVMSYTQDATASTDFNSRIPGNTLVCNVTHIFYYPGPQIVPDGTVHVEAALAGATGNRSIIADGAVFSVVRVG